VQIYVHFSLDVNTELMLMTNGRYNMHQSSVLVGPLIISSIMNCRHVYILKAVITNELSHGNSPLLVLGIGCNRDITFDV
jgi:hypothetical protein